MHDAENFSDKLRVQNELKKDQDYLMLSKKERDELFMEIMKGG